MPEQWSASRVGLEKGGDMFKTLVWATDGSETAAQALPYALELAAATHAKLVIAHVREIFVGRAGGYPVLADEDDLRRQIEQRAAELHTSGVDVSFVLRTCTAGHTAATVADIARETEAGLIVVGTHGYGRLAALLLGSVTHGVLHERVCPVLAIPTTHAVRANQPELATSTTE
jgi:universal stress protein A